MKPSAQSSRKPKLSPQFFSAQAKRALLDQNLQAAMARAHGGFVRKRRAAIDAYPEFESLREAGRSVRTNALSQLDTLLRVFETQVIARGGHVHWAKDSQDACRIITRICEQAGAKRIGKGKSMIGEEVGINLALEGAGLQVTETDLGEYIIQLAHETPSHIIAPAVHKSRKDVARLFATHHGQDHAGVATESDFPGETSSGKDSKSQGEIAHLVDEARRVLRQKFIKADVGITGANFLVAENGASVLVTNEGNGDLCATLPRTHIVLTSIEKVVPTMADATVLLRLLGRSATGQEISAYTSFFTGPRHPGDSDGPDEFHVVLLDNGRSQLLGSPYREILHCIRCGACLNYCPIYGAIGGHAYGWVYPGPMGAVLTPLLHDRRKARDLPQACTLNGRCQTVCSVKIPLPELLRGLRTDSWRHKDTAVASRLLGGIWAFFVKRPRLYAPMVASGVRVLSFVAKRGWHFRGLPVIRRWTGGRDITALSGETFQRQWKRYVRKKKKGTEGLRGIAVPDGVSPLVESFQPIATKSDPREEILERIGKNSGGNLAKEADVDDGQSTAGRPENSYLAALSQMKLWDRFQEKFTNAMGKMVRVSTLSQAAEEVIIHLNQYGLSHRLLVSGEDIPRAITWPEGIHISHGPAVDGDMVSITGAFAAVAETGTIVRCSGEHTPTTQNFLPDDHIVLLGIDAVLPHMEAVWQKIQEPWPRAVNFISGPSRTADIEQTMQVGAHGPKRLLVILICETQDPVWPK